MVTSADFHESIMIASDNLKTYRKCEYIIEGLGVGMI